MLSHEGVNTLLTMPYAHGRVYEILERLVSGALDLLDEILRSTADFACKIPYVSLEGCN